MTRMRTTMPIQNEILRLKGLGHNKSKVAELLGINRETVIKYWDGPIENLAPVVPGWVKEIDWDYVKNELRRASKKILYTELKNSVELPSYQAFCEYLRKHKENSLPEISIKIHRIPGASIEVDYSGDGIQILNPATGEIYTAQLFVGTFSYSGYFYGEFTLTQKLEDFIGAHINMFSFFGGVATYIVPDNCKTAIIKNDKVDPIINPTYQDMCVHYGIAVDPADPYSPKHKPNVENSIGMVQKEFFGLVRNKTFTSLIELNEFFRNWMIKKNEEMIRGRGQSRKFFYEQEKITLRCLPETPYSLFYFKKAKVHPDCCYMLDKNYYSVPHQFVGKELDIKHNSKETHAYSETVLIASHAVLRGHFHHSINVGHYPEKKYVDMNYHLALCRREASMIGENTSLLIERIFAQDSYPLKNLRKVQGILGLKNQIDREAFEYASEMALEFNKMNYDRVKRFAKGYRPERNNKTDLMPIRQQELICLQGGLQ